MTEKIKDVDLTEFAKAGYKRYGVAVLEDRAFPDYRDGLIPVVRHLLWAAYEMGLNSKAKHVKSARLVGDAMGRYHPHGDSSIYSALAKLTNANRPVALFDGSGNWGSLSDKGVAAMRYTETRLSKFSDAVLFNKFYIPVIDYVPNYDSSGKEPVVIPALLPLSIVNGVFGIAPGATTNIPACEYKSVLKTLYLAFTGEEVTPKFLYKNLKFRSTYGGFEEAPANDEAKAARASIFKTHKGAAVLQSDVTYDAATRTVTVTRFARDTEMEKLIPVFMDLEGVVRASDDSTTKDYYGRFSVTFKKGLNDKQYEKLINFTKQQLSSRENYCLNFTERYKDESGQAAANVRPMALTDMLQKWIKWRTELERKACAYWIKEDEKEMRRLDLLMQAVDMIDFIVALLKNEKLDQNQVYEAYAKKCKCTIEEAKYVLNRPIISLRRLDKKALSKDKADVEKNKRGLEKRYKKPEPYMAEQLKEWVKLGDH